eukprot:4319394-Amphidinium_carterae.1
MLPTVVIMENSDALIQKKFAKVSLANAHGVARVRDRIVDCITNYGYKVKWKVLNSKDYAGVPQNRSRFYLVAIKSEAATKSF